MTPAGGPDHSATVHERAARAAEPDEALSDPVPRATSRRRAYPSLHDWIHPVTRHQRADARAAGASLRRRARRHQRSECGAGHCGVDLDGPAGRPIVAVADGSFVRIERRELGLDGLSGRYVRIEHDDGTLTAYMHLDDIADGARGRRSRRRRPVHRHARRDRGVRVRAALHFSLEIPNHPGAHGDNTDTHYVDPAPFLVRATIADGRAPHPIKPASVTLERARD